MKYLKSILLPIVGLTILSSVTLIAYSSNSLFLEKLMICNLILILIFCIKILDENNSNQIDLTRKNKYLNN